MQTTLHFTIFIGLTVCRINRFWANNVAVASLLAAYNVELLFCKTLCLGVSSRVKNDSTGVNIFLEHTCLSRVASNKGLLLGCDRGHNSEKNVFFVACLVSVLPLLHHHLCCISTDAFMPRTVLRFHGCYQQEIQRILFCLSHKASHDPPKCWAEQRDKDRDQRPPARETSRLHPLGRLSSSWRTHWA
jgi:hypothetical protein